VAPAPKKTAPAPQKKQPVGHTFDDVK
jgi:hypothetical protein